MKSFIVVALFIAAVSAAPASQTPDGDAQIVAYENNNIGVEGYNFSVKTSNGIETAEEGVVKNIGTDNEALQVRGQFSYVGDNGVTYVITYTADENGFQPSGAHIPTA